MNSTPTSKKRKKRLEWERRLVFAKTDGHCFYCWDELDFIWDYVCDHYIPLSKGGADDHSNLVPACYFCDNRKRSFLPTPILCATLKKWKHGELVPKQYLDLPAAISKAKLTRGQERQIKRYKQSREAQIAWEQHQRARKSDKLSGFIPNPALPWHVLGNHTGKFLYGERSSDQLTEAGTPGGQKDVSGSNQEGGLHASGTANGAGGECQQSDPGCGGRAGGQEAG